MMLKSASRRIGGVAMRSTFSHSVLCGRGACRHAAAGPVTALCRHLHAHPNPPTSPDMALEYLKEGNKRFVTGKTHEEHPTRNMERVKGVAAGQKPFAAFLSCADSRVPVEIIFDQGFGDVFVTRVAGNIVTNEITASLEFGTAVLGAQVLMVLGHSSCGAVAATIAGAPVPGVISSLYYGIKPAVTKCGEPGHVHHAGCSHLDMCIEENVRHQVQQLNVSPVLTDLVKGGKLKIVGGVYDLASGSVKEVKL